MGDNRPSIGDPIQWPPSSQHSVTVRSNPLSRAEHSPNRSLVGAADRKAHAYGEEARESGTGLGVKEIGKGGICRRRLPAAVWDKPMMRAVELRLPSMIVRKPMMAKWKLLPRRRKKGEETPYVVTTHRTYLRPVWSKANIEERHRIPFCTL